MLPIRLCPSPCTESGFPSISLAAGEPSDRKVLELREVWVNSHEELPDTPEWADMRDMQKQFLDEIESSCDGLTFAPDSVALQPLQYCTMCIALEVLQTPNSLWPLGGGRFKESVVNLTQLLPSATVYQAGFDGVRKI